MRKMYPLELKYWNVAARARDAGDEYSAQALELVALELRELLAEAARRPGLKSMMEELSDETADAHRVLH